MHSITNWIKGRKQRLNCAPIEWRGRNGKSCVRPSKTWWLMAPFDRQNAPGHLHSAQTNKDSILLFSINYGLQRRPRIVLEQVIQLQQWIVWYPTQPCICTPYNSHTVAPWLVRSTWHARVDNVRNRHLHWFLNNGIIGKLECFTMQYILPMSVTLWPLEVKAIAQRPFLCITIIISFHLGTAPTAWGCKLTRITHHWWRWEYGIEYTIWMLRVNSNAIRLLLGINTFQLFQDQLI